MAFKEVNDLSPDVTVSLGGKNRTTGKLNPTSIEGYYLGKRAVEDRKKKSGKSYIYVFQTSKGNVGVWGKTDLDRKMEAATPGAMMRVTSTGTRPTPNGDMYVYKVEVDSDNSIEVSAAANSEADATDNPHTGSSFDSAFTDEEETTEDEEQDTSAAELAAAAAKAAANRAKVQALLSKKAK